MLDKVKRNQVDFNNSGRIANSGLLSGLKHYYYRFLLSQYSKQGKQVDVIFANSTWTSEHMKRVWPSRASDVQILYPPCSVRMFSQAPLERKGIVVMSFAQFRPEKDQML